MATSSRIRLVVLESSSQLGGVQHSTFNLLKHLDRDKWDVLVLCPEEGKLPDMLRAEGIEVRIVPLTPMHSTSVWTRGLGRVPSPYAWLRNGLILLQSVGRIAVEIHEAKAQLLLTKGLQSHFIGGMAAKRANIPCVWHLQDLISERLGGMNLRLTSMFMQRYASSVIADGQAIRGQYPPMVRESITVILNGIDTELFRPGSAPHVRNELEIPQDAVLIGHVARITPWKGQKELLEAFCSIAELHRDAHLLFVGSPLFDGEAYMHALFRMAQQSPYANRVHFAGYRVDLPEVLRAIDIAAYPSLEKDTSPLALLSAMSCGLPVVGFSIDGVTELISDGVSGLMVPIGDVSALAAALSRLITEKSFRKQIGMKSRETAINRFDMVMYIQAIEQVLCHVIRGNVVSYSTMDE